LALVWLTACGGSAQSTAPGQGSAGAETGAGQGGAFAGAGGKVPDVAGGAGAGPLACSTPYAGPSGGPRSDGPPDLGGCASISDADVLARYNDLAARVPKGLYYEPNESITFWKPPCSKSVDDTAARGPTDGLGTFLGSYENDWFYEATYCFDGSLRRIERNLRCDYFDGEKLANATPERLAFLASMLWWGEQSNVTGSLLLGHEIVSADSADFVELCTVSTIYGDFGLCTEVRLESTKLQLRAFGSVTLGAPQVVRTLLRDCK